MRKSIKKIGSSSIILYWRLVPEFVSVFTNLRHATCSNSIRFNACANSILSYYDCLPWLNFRSFSFREAFEQCVSKRNSRKHSRWRHSTVYRLCLSKKIYVFGVTTVRDSNKLLKRTFSLSKLSGFRNVYKPIGRWNKMSPIKNEHLPIPSKGFEY